jgi:hypothetical protein
MGLCLGSDDDLIGISGYVMLAKENIRKGTPKNRVNP